MVRMISTKNLGIDIAELYGDCIEIPIYVPVKKIALPKKKKRHPWRGKSKDKNAHKA